MGGNGKRGIPGSVGKTDKIHHGYSVDCPFPGLNNDVCVCVERDHLWGFAFTYFLASCQRLPSNNQAQQWRSFTLLRLTKNDRLRLFKPTNSKKNMQAHTYRRIVFTRSRVAASPLLLPSQTSSADTQTPLWLQLHFPVGADGCISAQRLTRECKHTLVIVISSQLTSLFNDLNPHAGQVLLPLLLFIVFPVNTGKCCGNSRYAKVFLSLCMIRPAFYWLPRSSVR